MFYDENGKPKDYETLDDLDRAMEQLFEEKRELLKELINRSFFLVVNKYFTDADLRSILGYYLKVKKFREFDKDSKDIYDEEGNLSLFIEDVKDFDEERMRRIAEKIEEFIDFSGKTLKYFIEAADMNDLRPLLMRLLQAEYFMVRFAHEIYRMLRKEIEEYREKNGKKTVLRVFKKNKPDEELIRDYVIDKIKQIAKDLGLTIRLIYHDSKEMRDKSVVVPRDGSEDNLDASIKIDNMIRELKERVLFKEKEDKVWGGNASEGLLHRFVFGTSDVGVPDKKFYANRCVLDHEERLKILYNIVKEKDRITPKDIILGNIKYFNQTMFSHIYAHWEMSGGFIWNVSSMFLWPITWVWGIKIDGNVVRITRMEPHSCILSDKEYGDKSKFNTVCYLVRPLPYVLTKAEDKNGERKPLLIGDLMTPESFKETFRRMVDLWIEYLKSLSREVAA